MIKSNIMQPQTKRTLLIISAILLFIGLTFLTGYLLGVKNRVKEVPYKPDNSIFIRDSLNVVLKKHDALNAFKMDSVRQSNKAKDKVIYDVKKEYKRLRDSINPKTTTPNAQVSIYLQNFNIGNDYTDYASLPVQSCYMANLNFYDNKECQRIKTIQDSQIASDKFNDSIAQVRLKDKDNIIHNDSISKVSLVKDNTTLKANNDKLVVDYNKAHKWNGILTKGLIGSVAGNILQFVFKR
jgi:hypothetical protein